MNKENNIKLEKQADSTDFTPYLTSDNSLKRGTPERIRRLFFIKKLIKIFGYDRYDFSTLEYTTSKEKCSLFCPECKTTFSQLPHNLRNGKGCPTCAKKSRVRGKNR